MANHGQMARLVSRTEDPEPTAADLFDPVALEARLVEARARRAAAIARRNAAEPTDPASRAITVSPGGARRPRVAAPVERVPIPPEVTAKASSRTGRITRDGLLAAVFAAGLLGGFALVLLAPAGLRQEIARLIAPESGTVPPSGSANLPPTDIAPTAGDESGPEVATAFASNAPAFPARPGFPLDDDAARMQPVQVAPGAETAPEVFAEAPPPRIVVSPRDPDVRLARADDAVPSFSSGTPLTPRPGPPVPLGPVAHDGSSGGSSGQAFPVPPRIERAPEFAMPAVAARLSGPSSSVRDVSRGPAPVPTAAAEAESAPVPPEAGLSSPQHSRSPDVRLVAADSAAHPLLRLAATPSRLYPEQELPLTSLSDTAPDSSAELAALADAARTAALLTEKNQPLAVSAIRGLPTFSDSGSWAPVSGEYELEDFAGDGKASIFADANAKTEIVMATFWPDGELIAAAPVRKASKPAAVRQKPANATRPADQAVAEQVTRIILQRRVERMLRDLR